MSHANRIPMGELLSGLGGSRRLGRNFCGYRGETIDIDAVLGECLTGARKSGWESSEISVASQPSLLTFQRCTAPDIATVRRVPRVYISSGIHGDEPAGPLAIRQLLLQDLLPHGLALWLCPCLNPAGFRNNRRENSQGLDLNRQYLRPTAPETAAHIAWLEAQPAFDLSLCVHEDWEAGGFYVYELNPDRRRSLAESVVAAVEKVCPIDQSELIEGRPARNGIIRPNVDPHSRPDWPEAFFLITHKTRLSYTLEAPSDFPIVIRVAALVEAILAALGSLSTD